LLRRNRLRILRWLTLWWLAWWRGRHMPSKAGLGDCSSLVYPLPWSSTAVYLTCLLRPTHLSG
jgi:hypothetical protein